MQKCKKKDGLIYDFEVAEIKKVEYRIYSNDDFICAMSENDFKENFEILEEDTTECKEEEASYIVKPVDWYKTIGIDYTDEKFKEKVYSMIPSNESKEDYKEDLKYVKNLIREIRKKTIVDIIKYKEMEIERNQDFLSKGLKIPIARPISQFFSDEIIRLRQEIEVLKCTLEGMEKNNEKM